MNTRKCGGRYEEAAARMLAASGYDILERNFRCKFGEIDIIAKDRKTLVFVEVKFRKNRAGGYPEEAVSYAKQRKISLVAGYYCMMHGISDSVECRFDVVAIDGGGMRHHVNAFMYRV